MTATSSRILRLRRWSKEALWLLLLAVIISTALDLWRSPALPEGSPLPQLLLQDGTLADLQTMSRDRPLLIYYWASWCAVCRVTTPTVEQLWRDGENVLTVALRSGDPARLQQGIARKGLTFPTHNDEHGDLAARWQVSVTPSFLIIKQGKVVSSTTGWSSGPGLKLRLAWASLG